MLCHFIKKNQPFAHQTTNTQLQSYTYCTTLTLANSLTLGVCWTEGTAALLAAARAAAK